MISLKLLKNNTWHIIDLSPDVTIPGEIACDMLELEFNEAERTYPFEIPASMPNVRFFGDPGKLTRREYLFREYEGQLLYSNTIFKSGLFKLTDAAADFKGFLKAPQSKLALVKDKLLSQVISDRMCRLFMVAETMNEAELRGAVLFPTVYLPNFYDSKTLKTWERFLGDNIFNKAGFFNVYDAAANSYVTERCLPAMRQLVVLEALLREVGYEVQYNFSTEDLDKVLLFGHCAADNPFDVFSDYSPGLAGDISFSQALPAITVSDFLKSLRVNFGLKLSFRPGDVCELDLLKDLVKKPGSIDITPYITNKPARQEDKTDFYFSFSGGSNDSDIPSQLDVRDPVVFKENLPAGDFFDTNSCRLVLAENRYYALIQDDGLKWVPLDIAYEPEKEADSQLDTVITPVEMIQEVELTFRTMGCNFDGWSGWKLSPIFDFLDPLKDTIQVIAPEQYKSEVSNFHIPAGEFEYLFQFVNQGGAIQAPLSSAPEELTVVLKTTLPFIVPVIREKGSSNFLDFSNPDFKPRMALYHGLQPYKKGTGKTAFANSGNYDNKGKKISPFALRYSGADGLAAYFWEDVLQWFRESEKIKVNALLPVDFIRRFDDRIKLHLKGATAFASNIKYLLTNQGIEISAIEMRKLRNEAVVVEESRTLPGTGVGYGFDYDFDFFFGDGNTPTDPETGAFNYSFDLTF